MFNKYFRTAFRQLRGNGANSLLNLFGLAIGIACTGLIFLWVEDEMGFDGNNVKKDRIYITKINAKIDAGIFTHSSTPGLLGPAMKSDIPGVINTCRKTEEPVSLLFNAGDKPVYAAGLYAEPSVFSLFTLPFVQGDAGSAFSQMYSLVITEKTARKLFGVDAGNVVGRTIRVDNKQDYVIGGVLKDLPENSTLQFEWLAPFDIFYQQSPWAHKWENFCVTTFVELKPGVDPGLVNKQLYNFLQEKSGDAGLSSRPFLFGMKDWRLYDMFANGLMTGGGRIEYVHLFSVIAWIILFIACINFMNLATARSEKRAREVGVRKVLGAGKGSLFLQFIGEAMLLAALAMLLAVIFISMALPAFNGLVQKQLVIGLWEPAHLIALIAGILVCGFVAGSYPALYLSSFRPVFVLKGIKLKTGSAALIRKGLVVLQFTASIVLIIATVIIFQQIRYVKGRDLGFRKENLVRLDLQGDMKDKFQVIRQDLINTGLVENAALADHEAIYSGNNTTSISWPGKVPGSLIVISQRLVSPEYLSVLGMKVKEGRDFQSTDVREMNAGQTALKDSTAFVPVIVTESLAKIMGHGSVIGRGMSLPGDGMTYNLRVVGVVKDYLYGDMYTSSDPVMFYCLPQVATLLYVRVKAGVASSKVMEGMAAVLKKVNPSYPFEYEFVDDQFDALFSDEMLMSRLSGIFAGLAIFISCLGLFGLAAYTAERRTKEIGIRKVLGASATGLAALLSKDFLRLVIMSWAIAFPIAWLTMQHWLKSYAYRIDIRWWVFALAGGMAVMIALATVSYQAFKAALANPVKSMRTE